MEGVNKFKSVEVRRHSACSYVKRSDNETSSSSCESVCGTPLCTRGNLEALLFAPRKKKTNVITRRSSAPASLLDYSDIRKRLDFGGIKTDTPSYIIRGKRKIQRGQISSVLHCNDLIIPFSDLQLTPKSSKKVKFHTDVDKSSNNFCVPYRIGTPVCSRNIMEETPISDSYSWMSKKRKLGVATAVHSHFMEKLESISSDQRFTKTGELSQKLL